jgi:glyoxylase-like metal-dependent hydrolase (beta-lactamase superfamily II)
MEGNRPVGGIVNMVAASAFVVGGSLFAIGAAFAQGDVGTPRLVAGVYLAGGVFFSTGGYFSILAARNGSPLESLSALVLFVGTLVFGINLLDSLIGGLSPAQEDRLVWSPDMVGCALFLVSGHLAMVNLSGSWLPCWRPRERGWWVVAVNQLGSALFMVSAVASLVRAEGDEIAIGIANWGTLTGALCFAVAGVILERPPGLKVNPSVTFRPVGGGGDARHAWRRGGVRGFEFVSADLKPEAPRGERVLPGIWRLRTALPWPGVPHGNAWAVAADGGIVLFDTGIGGKDRLRHLDLALAQVGFGLADVRLLVCTHSHTDHYGLAASIVEQAGCELWMHPAWGHVRLMAEDPAAALEQRIEIARQSGVPPAGLERYRERRRENDDTGIDGIVAPDRELVPGVEVESDLGAWQVYETPGHAPSHVVLHQPDRKLLISGDHLLGRTVLFFDYGHSPDPIGEFLGSLDEVEPLEVDLCLPGHGRPFRDPEAKIAESRRQVDELLGKVRAALAGGEKTAFEIVAGIIGPDSVNSPVSAWVLQIVLSCLDHLAILGEAEAIEGTDPQHWASTT